MKKIIRFLQRLLNKTKYYAKLYVHPSIQVVQGLKTFFDSPAVPILTAIIPGEVDNIIAGRIRTYLPIVLKVLGYADECINAKTDDAILQCAIAKIRLLNPDGQDAACHNIAALLSKYLSDGRLTWRECIHIAEEIFWNEFKPVQAA